MPVAVKRNLRAFIARQEAARGLYSAHIEDRNDRSRIVASRDGELAELIAWARERTGWVLVVEEPMMWAGSDPAPHHPDIKRIWPE
jgi:hypothetical protein